LKPASSDQPIAENALATYGIILAVILSIAALVVGFGKTNIFIILALSPMVIYFFHEFGHRLTPKSDGSATPKAKHYHFGAFLLQDSPMLRLTLSLFILALVAALAKTNLSPLGANQANSDIISPISTSSR
jgi:hypothetical protein